MADQPNQEQPVQDQMTDAAKIIQATATQASKSTLFQDIEKQFNELPQSLADKANNAPLNQDDAEVENEPAPVKETKSAPKVEAASDDDQLIPEAAIDPEKAAKKDETVSVDKEKFIQEQTKGMSPKAADRFRGISDRAFKAETQHKEAVARIAELEASVAKSSGSEVEELKAKLDEYDAIIQKSNLENHPKFRAHYAGAIEKEIALAEAAVGSELKGEVKELLQLPDSKIRNDRLKAIIRDLADDPIAEGKLKNAVYTVDKLNGERNQELANWKENKARMEKMSSADANASAEQFTRETESALSQIMRKMSDPKEGVEIFRRVEGNEKWNALVDRRVAEVKKMASERDLSRADVVALSTQAVMGKEYRQLFLQQAAVIHKLKTEMQAIKNSAANLGGSDNARTGDLPDTMSFADRMVEIAKREGAVR